MALASGVKVVNLSIARPMEKALGSPQLSTEPQVANPPRCRVRSVVHPQQLWANREGRGARLAPKFDQGAVELFELEIPNFARWHGKPCLFERSERSLLAQADLGSVVDDWRAWKQKLRERRNF